MANSPESARSYSSPPSPHSIAANYAWSPSFIQTGAYQPITGNWIPFNVDPSGNLGVTIAGATFTGNLEVDNSSLVLAQASGNAYAAAISGKLFAGIAITGGSINSGFYGFFNSGITGSQMQIPAGVMSWSVFVESGFGFVNNVLYNTFENLQGGGYDGNKRLSTPINVGGTGSAAAPTRILISYES